MLELVLGLLGGVFGAKWQAQNNLVSAWFGPEIQEFGNKQQKMQKIRVHSGCEVVFLGKKRAPLL